MNSVLNDLLKSPLSRPGTGLKIVRITIGLIIGVHAVHGLVNPAATNGFGGYLGSIGFPFGIALAWIIQIGQFCSCVGLIFGRLVVPSCIFHLAILGIGIGLVHFSSGWFVVGAGRNGMEYSITLMGCIVAILWGYWPVKRSTS
jgi:putative oxidoreductase